MPRILKIIIGAVLGLAASYLVATGLCAMIVWNWEPFDLSNWKGLSRHILITNCTASGIFGAWCGAIHNLSRRI